jgi:Tfp pilus assembly protein PilN
MITINLLAPSRRARPALRPVTVLAVAVPVALLATLAVWTVALQERVAREQRELAETAQKAAELRPLVQQVQALDRAAGQMRQRQAILQQLLGTQLPATASLEAVRAIIPRDAWLVNVTTLGTRRVTFDGYTFSYRSVAQFMVDLGDSARFQNVDLTSTQKDKIGDREVVKFQVTGDLVPERPVAASVGGGVR